MAKKAAPATQIDPRKLAKAETIATAILVQWYGTKGTAPDKNEIADVCDWSVKFVEFLNPSENGEA